MWILCVEFDKNSVDIILVFDILEFEIGFEEYGILAGKTAIFGPGINNLRGSWKN